MTTARLGVGVGAGLLIGAVSEWLVLRVPFAFLPLSNSAAPWIMVAFLAALGARSVRGSLGVAVMVLVAAIVGFYAAQATRGWEVSGHQLAFWCTVAVVAGPVIGLAAGCMRHAANVWGALGAGVLGGLLVGEAVHGLGQPAFLSPHDYWRVQLGVGVALALVLTVCTSRESWPRRLPLLITSLAACASAAVATAVFYQIA